MKTYSSTVLQFFAKHCPAALGFYEAGQRGDDTIYQSGIAAHAVLQYVGEDSKDGSTKDWTHTEAVADGVVKKLITEGRKYYDEHHPPMPPELAIEGRDIALKYLQSHSLPVGADFEIVLGMDSDGNPTSDKNKMRYRAIIDVVYKAVAGDDEFMADVIAIDDYKSAWPTGKEELTTLQRKGQAVLAWLHYPEMQGVRMGVINLRTGEIFEETILFDEDGIKTLERWRKDILMLCDAADATREARPGIGCVGCPFLSICPDAKKAETAADSAKALVVLDARRDELRRNLKLQLAEADGVKVNGGYVGFSKQQKSVLSDEAYYQILGNWYNMPLADVQDRLGHEVGLLKALGIGSGQVTNFAKDVFDGEHRVERTDFVELCTAKKTVVEFGAWEATPEELSKLKLIEAPPVDLPVKKKESSGWKKKAETLNAQVWDLTGELAEIKRGYEKAKSCLLAFGAACLPARTENKSKVRNVHRRKTVSRNRRHQAQKAGRRGTQRRKKNAGKARR